MRSKPTRLTVHLERVNRHTYTRRTGGVDAIWTVHSPSYYHAPPSNTRLDSTLLYYYLKKEKNILIIYVYVYRWAGRDNKSAAVNEEAARGITGGLLGDYQGGARSGNGARATERRQQDKT